MRREVAIRGLVVYLGEKEENLFKDQLVDGDYTNELLKMIVTRDPPRACALLMGLIYSLNLSYPRELKKTPLKCFKSCE
ncbi:uncharacterized protein ACBR49_009365 [Aulostomus maculatus]